MVYLDFEQPIAELNEQLEKIKEVQTKGDVDVSTTIKDIETQIAVKTKEIYENLSAWQQVQVSRHPQRPYTFGYIDHITDDNSFIELHGDRNVGDDKAMVGGMGSINGESVMFIGQQKGINTKMRQYRNFGMPNPEGYRKALRLMKMAEKFNIPVVCLIDPPGAFPGLEAEERGQGEAIARNLIEMAQLKVSLVCVVIGEGASGGALGIGMGDKVFMMENTWYSVISPENCSTILWRSWDHKEEAAEKMKLTSQDMLELGLIDGVIKEPVGGAHADPEKAFENVKNAIIDSLNELRDIEPQKRVTTRIKKFSSMGHYEEA